MKFSDLQHIIFDHWPIKIACIALAVVLNLLFRVNTLDEQQYSIPLNIIIPEDFSISSDYPRFINISLRGNKDDIKNILQSDIIALIDISAYPEEGTYQKPIEIRKTGTALALDALEIRPRPRAISISLEKRTERSLTVLPNLTGFPAVGYELTQYFVSPSSVTAIGPRSQLDGFTNLSTELIDLSNHRSNFTQSTRIVLPSPRIELPGGTAVEFRGVVEESIIIRTITDIILVVFDLPNNLHIAGELPKASLTLQGNQLAIEDLRPQDITLSVDGSEIRIPGNYTLPVDMDIPSGFAVLGVSPRNVQIQVEETVLINEAVN